MVYDLVKLIYVAEKESEVSLITDLLKQLYHDGTSTQQALSSALHEKWVVVLRKRVVVSCKSSGVM